MMLTIFWQYEKCIRRGKLSRHGCIFKFSINLVYKILPHRQKSKFILHLTYNHVISLSEANLLQTIKSRRIFFFFMAYRLFSIFLIFYSFQKGSIYERKAIFYKLTLRKRQLLHLGFRDNSLCSLCPRGRIKCTSPL